MNKPLTPFDLPAIANFMTEPEGRPVLENPLKILLSSIVM